MNHCCAHNMDVDTIEALALGLLEDQEETVEDVKMHLDACSTCREVYEQMLDEARLFEQRAAVMDVTDAPPFLAPDLLDAISDQERRPITARLMPALVAVAACAAMFAGVAQINRHTFGAAALPAHLVDGEPASMQTRADSFGEEPASCAWPASGVVRIEARHGHGHGRDEASLSSSSWGGSSSSDRGLGALPQPPRGVGFADSRLSLCEERVTSSIATP